jgi:two-component system NtrC family sensor kinase
MPYLKKNSASNARVNKKHYRIFYTTRSKLIASFLGVSFLVGGVSSFIGSQLLYKAVLSEATSRVSLDLNSAREIYLHRIDRVKVALSIKSMGLGFRSDLKSLNVAELVNRVRRVAQQAELDFAGILTKEGTTLCRMGPNSIPKESVQPANPIAKLVLKRGDIVAGTAVLSNEFLSAEDPELADRSRIQVVPTPRAATRAETEETAGMALVVAIPVFEDDNLLGVLYGGILLNRSQKIVDLVRDTVFQQETYKGHSIGTATLFLNDVRISTNVLTPEGKRAIGTRASREVKEHVLTKGKKWTDRAFVVSDWYITAYEPIEDIFDEKVGMLYVGVLEAKYVDIRRNTLAILVFMTLAGIILAIGLGYILAQKIMNPVHRLIKASEQVSEGSLSPDIGPISNDEIGVLQNTFMDMIKSVGRRRAEAENRLLQSEKQASFGRLAAGVAHEVNNPLTGVLTYTHMLLRRKDLSDEVRSDLETIANATERVRKIIKGVLDFARQTTLDPEPTDINRLVRSTISVMENQALVRGVSIKFSPGDYLPLVTLDRSQFQSVLLNIIINSLDATKPGDNVTISTGFSLSASDGGHSGRKGIEITIADTGCGIPPENLDKLFDPFFTTKEVGKGTGLGLAVSFGIVQRHRGTIRVKSEVGKGSTFFIWLPIGEQAE